MSERSHRTHARNIFGLIARSDASRCGEQQARLIKRQKTIKFVYNKIFKISEDNEKLINHSRLFSQHSIVLDLSFKSYVLKLSL